jgi:hypothetical protein
LPQATPWVERPTSKFGSLCVKIGMAHRRDGRQLDVCSSDSPACQFRGWRYGLWEWS